MKEFMRAVKIDVIVTSVVCILDDKAHYYPGASSFMVKITAENESRRLLGIQVG